MAVTPNYGWPVPVATDYVKDGWEAISDLGNAIDTTVAALPTESMTLISTTTLTGASITLSSIPQTYKNLYIVIRNFKPSTSGQALYVRINNDSGTNYLYNIGNINTANGAFADNAAYAAANNDGTTATGLTQIELNDYANAVTRKFIVTRTLGNVSGAATNAIWSQTSTMYSQTTAVSSLVFFAGSGNLNGGSVLLYGVK